jgi:hypothetical protein
MEVELIGLSLTYCFIGILDIDELGDDYVKEPHLTEVTEQTRVFSLQNTTPK